MKFHLVLIKNLREGFLCLFFLLSSHYLWFFFLVLPKALAEFFKWTKHKIRFHWLLVPSVIQQTFIWHQLGVMDFIRICKSKITKRRCLLSKQSLESVEKMSSVYCTLEKHSERRKHVGYERIKEGSLNQTGTEVEWGEGWVLKNEIGGKWRGWEGFLRENNMSKHMGPCSMRCAMCHVYVEKGTTMCSVGPCWGGKRLEKYTDAGHRSLVRHLQEGTFHWIFKSRSHWVI